MQLRSFPSRRAGLSLTLALVTLTACRAGDVVSVPPADPQRRDMVIEGGGAAMPHADAALRRRLERAAAGLSYTSESDVPFTWFFAVGPVDAPLTATGVRALVRAAPDEPVETVSLERFFARHIERVDPADSVALALVPRYRRLRETLRHSVAHLRVFRVGRIRIQCLLVGTDEAGNVVGLRTEAIET